jgi:hypothetical protein
VATGMKWVWRTERPCRRCGLKVDQARRLKELVQENAKLKCLMVSELSLEKIRSPRPLSRWPANMVAMDIAGLRTCQGGRSARTGVVERIWNRKVLKVQETEANCAVVGQRRIVCEITVSARQPCLELRPRECEDA